MALFDFLALLNDLGHRPKIALALFVGILLGVAALVVLPSSDYKVFLFLGLILLSLGIGLVWQLKTEPQP